MGHYHTTLHIIREIRSRGKRDFDSSYRIVVLGRIAAFLSLISSAVILAMDYWQEWNGFVPGNLTAAIFPGSVSAHLYFRFVQVIAAMRGERAVVLLGVCGSLVVLSLHVYLFGRAVLSHSMKGLAFFMFFETLAVYAAGQLFPLTDTLAAYALIGAALRLGLGIVLLIGHRSERWCGFLCASDRILWAADKYGWSESFDLGKLSEEEWDRIYEEYREEMEKTEKDEEDPRKSA